MSYRAMNKKQIVPPHTIETENRLNFQRIIFLKLTSDKLLWFSNWTLSHVVVTKFKVPN